MPLLAAIDPWILSFSAITVLVTVWMGFRSAKTSKSASDFFVAGRSVGVGMNASAISGEYLSAASFMGVAGMVMSSGYDALWYPVCYACGYLFLLLFIAGPLRRFGAYTIPDFAEGRYDSPLFRKIAVIFVLFIGFFYTMPQMKGAGVTLAYIFPGLPYWVGVVLVGAVITLNVALGGMKGITLVQAFQYWAKMFAISVPVFVLMAVYGGYGKQLEMNRGTAGDSEGFEVVYGGPGGGVYRTEQQIREALNLDQREYRPSPSFVAGVGPNRSPTPLRVYFYYYGMCTGQKFLRSREIDDLVKVSISTNRLTPNQFLEAANQKFAELGVILETNKQGEVIARLKAIVSAPDTRWSWTTQENFHEFSLNNSPSLNEVKPMMEADGPLIHKAQYLAGRLTGPKTNFVSGMKDLTVLNAIGTYNTALRRTVWVERSLTNSWTKNAYPNPGFQVSRTKEEYVNDQREFLAARGIESISLPTGDVALVPKGEFERYSLFLATYYHSVGSLRKPLPEKAPKDDTWISPFGPLTTKATKAAKIEGEAARPYSLLYTYSLIIALVCGTAGLPHILVRFYTNPDGVAAKKTTMWVMILIGIFYVFPPVFGVMGRNLFPELYNGVGAKGTDKIVLELPRLLNEKYGVLGSVLSGITCAGAFAAFMSTFSGLLVSMTGALAHDVYGRILRPKSTPDERMRMFKWCAVFIGAVAMLLGSFVEKLEINFMVGQAFAIAAASYFPLLFMSVWWRGMTLKGAATGMLAGGFLSVIAISLTSVTTLAAGTDSMAETLSMFKPLIAFFAEHPLLRILCEQPAIWAVPLAITLMVVVSKLTRREVPADIRMKMLVLHAPEKLGLKQEYIQEHQAGPGH